MASLPPICEEFKKCHPYPQWQCQCGQSNWRNRVACWVCQRPHPEGDAHTAALREELEEQARLKDIKERGQGDKQPKPGSKEYATYLEKTAKMLKDLVKMCGEEPAAVLREKYNKEKAEHEAARPLDERVKVARRGLDQVEAKLEAARKRHAQFDEEQRKAAEKRDAEAAAIAELEADACKAKEDLQAVKAEVEREGTAPPKAGEAEPGEAGVGAGDAGVDPALVTGLRNVLEKNGELRSGLQGVNPVVDQALAALRAQGILSPEPGAAGPEVQATGPDDPMQGSAATLASVLDKNAEFKQTWDAMLRAGGDEVRQCFAPILERAKRTRTAPYDTDEKKDVETKDEKQGP